MVGAAALYEVATFWLGWHWSRSRTEVVGTGALVGARAVAIEDCRPDGWVRVNGELWRASCTRGVNGGELVRVVAVRGLTLVVEPG